MIVEVNYAAKSLRIIFQTPDESLNLREEYMFLYTYTEGDIKHEYLQRFTTLNHRCGDICFNGADFIGIVEEIRDACLSAYLMVENAVNKIPIIDFLSTQFFTIPTEAEMFTAHRKTMEVTIKRQVDVLKLELRA